MSDAIANHRRACDGFSAIVAQGAGHWSSQSPCPEWDARDVVEHVIGFHDELLLAPTATEPARPEDDPVARWALTVSAIDSAEEAPGDVDLDQLLPVLTSEVLAHTWDLAMAIGIDPNLDPELCAASHDVMRSNEEQMRASGLFDASITPADHADAAARHIAFLGRDPAWTR
jgi:uncharacterized protein (TIGR03086 family)